jgi:hypothetical protein
MVRFDRIQTVVAFGIVVTVLATIAVPLARAQQSWKPLLLEGYNADVITDKDPFVVFAQPFDVGGAVGCCWFESGAFGFLNGLPAGQTVESAPNNIPFLIQPAVLPNVLQLRGLGTVIAGALELEAPAAYRDIAIYASSGNGTPTSVGTGFILYDDFTGQSFTYNDFDWCYAGQLQAALPPPFSPAARNCTALPGPGFTYNTDCDQFQIYETIVATDPTKKIVSLIFLCPQDTYVTNIFAVSGLP